VTRHTLRIAAAALAALVVAASPVSGAAAAAAGPQEHIRNATDKILAVLKDPALKAAEKKEERRRAMIAAVDECFNWPDMAQRALARHWQPRTPAERKEFVPLFTELVRHTYMANVEGYTGEQVLYKGERIDGAYARVNVVIVTRTNVEVPVEYSVKRYDGKWLVYDVAVEGVKLVNNYRTQFASMLNSTSYPQFIEKLKAKVAEMKEQ